MREFKGGCNTGEGGNQRIGRPSCCSMKLGDLSPFVRSGTVEQTLKMWIQLQLRVGLKVGQNVIKNFVFLPILWQGKSSRNVF